ncbi:MAG: hypothetical protein LBM93_05145 [Oscillospiraceae bacterium]|jgi:hypothetical protein|nr:hypothetical protein [Oscillospiraceae bacterium]
MNRFADWSTFHDTVQGQNYKAIKNAVKDCDVSKNPSIKHFEKGWIYPTAYTDRKYGCDFIFQDGSKRHTVFTVSNGNPSYHLSDVGGTECISESHNYTVSGLFYKWVRTKEGWKLYRDTSTGDFTNFQGVVLPLKTHLKTLFKELYFYNNTVTYHHNYD